jgi:MFS family permease
MFFTNIRAMLAIISSMIAMVFMLFYNAIISNHLIDTYDVPEDQVGYILALGALFYALSSPLVSIVFKGVPRRYVTFLALIVSSVALFLFGPSVLLDIPQKLGIVIFAICLLGIAIALIFVPLLSEIIEAVMEKEGLGENPILNDKSSAVFNGAYATGCIIGPILGGALDDEFHFRKTCDIMALAAAGFAAIYFLINIVPHFFISKKK